MTRSATDIYLDTSFLLPYYLDEPHSLGVERVIRAAAPGELVTSEWALVEFASAVARLVRSGALDGDPQVLLGALETHTRDVYVVVTPERGDHATARAMLVADPHLGLRGPDALHLALAWRHGEVLHTLDRKLLACARALGVAATDAGLLP